MPDLTARTPAPGCPACAAQRVHNAEEWREYHPLAGHGYVPETGWTHPELKDQHDKESQP